MALTSVISRHPRYSLLLVVVLIAASFLLFPSAPVSFNSISDVDYFRNRNNGRPLKAVLRDEEQRYQKVLADREAMVRKWGPTADKVTAFPPEHDFYTMWDFFIPAFQCPHHTERIGTMGDGGKWVCGIERMAQQPSCVVYSFGINGESSFEADILTRAPGCQVYGYDFSVLSFGPEIASSVSLAPRSHFWSYGLGPKDAHSNGENPPMWSLESLMRVNGHRFIDILKIDIEGAEFESLGAFVDSLIAKKGGREEDVVLPIGQLQIEIHARTGGYDTFAPFKQWWEKLERVGLRPFWTEPNLVYVNLIRGARPDLVENFSTPS
ncbi:unnamed protein product [Somion occarium]|uniref:Methyltransferase domain-containing protein n=1 Tax=Somion occarium TaxID=3059160 RepID=A0ABP1DDF2_9APHY